MSIRLGVIGVGYLGWHHARLYSELSSERRDIVLAAVADADMGKAGEAAAKYGCNAYADYRDMLDKVDAVSIAAPTLMHYEIAMECIKAGKDILIEKPITAAVEEADELICASDKSGIIIQVGHIERFNPAISSLFSSSGQLLRNIGIIEAERLSPFLGRGIDVDITLDLMIHDIDIILAIISSEARRSANRVREPLTVTDTDNGHGRRQGLSSVSIKDIKASGTKIMTDNIDMAKACIEFEGGIRAWLTASRVSSEKTRKIKIFQQDSYITVDYQEMELKRFFKSGNEVVEEDIRVEKREPLREELKDFIECVAARRRPLVSAIEGRDALKIALEIGEKIRNETNA